MEPVLACLKNASGTEDREKALDNILNIFLNPDNGKPTLLYSEVLQTRQPSGLLKSGLNSETL